MNKKILIAYASATGSTLEIAAEIGKTLGARGFTVDVKSVRENPQVEDYEAVLIGSAVQYGKWLPEAVDFVKRNQGILRRLPVALFCVHIQNLEDDWQSRRRRLAYLDAVRPLVESIDEGYFAGRFDRQGAALLMPRFLARFIRVFDRRDWDKIRLWAERLGSRLHQPAELTAGHFNRPTL
jgi:menaquinone-dependent protoporphyrinogen oxidase